MSSPEGGYFNSSDSQERIESMGHRGFVGGSGAELWFGIGRLQYHYLVCSGLAPSHRFLDVGCGSLRLGQFLIPYLDVGNYFGLDAEPLLISAGIEHELGRQLADLKQPSFSVNHDFDFSFCDSFDIAMAQSVFTHLVPEDILKCLLNLRGVALQGSRFYFTFFLGDSSANLYEESHANRCWFYQIDTLQGLCEQAGWRFEYIGDWGHPRNQKICLATPR